MPEETSSRWPRIERKGEDIPSKWKRGKNCTLKCTKQPYNCSFCHCQRKAAQSKGEWSNLQESEQLQNTHHQLHVDSKLASALTK